MKIIKSLVAVVLLVVALGVGYAFSGLYPVGADVPHNALTYWLMDTLRESSVEAASEDIKVPNLDDPKLLAGGGPDYNEMCASCHLQPGVKQTEISVGLYPSPPNLTLRGEEDSEQDEPNEEAREYFWVIKHGIKASGMAAWGKTHDDQRIWAMVAFIRQLPSLSPAEYQILTAGGEDDDDDDDHQH